MNSSILTVDQIRNKKYKKNQRKRQPEKTEYILKQSENEIKKY